MGWGRIRVIPGITCTELTFWYWDVIYSIRYWTQKHAQPRPGLYYLKYIPWHITADSITSANQVLLMHTQVHDFILLLFIIKIHLHGIPPLCQSHFKKYFLQYYLVIFKHICKLFVGLIWGHTLWCSTSIALPSAITSGEIIHETREVSGAWTLSAILSLKLNIWNFLRRHMTINICLTHLIYYFHIIEWISQSHKPDLNYQLQSTIFSKFVLCFRFYFA